MTDDTIICRCEEVTLGEIKKAVALGLVEPGELRKYTRAGMGSCQGRTCQRLLMQIIKRETGEDTTIDNQLHPRIPIQSMTIRELCVYEED